MYHYDYRTWKWTTWTMQVTRFIYADKAKGVKCLLFLPQYIEHKISKSNEISIRMNEQKNILEKLAEVIRPFKTGWTLATISTYSSGWSFPKPSADYNHHHQRADKARHALHPFSKHGFLSSYLSSLRFTKYEFISLK